MPIGHYVNLYKRPIAFIIKRDNIGGFALIEYQQQTFQAYTKSNENFISSHRFLLHLLEESYFQLLQVASADRHTYRIFPPSDRFFEHAAAAVQLGFRHPLDSIKE